MSAAPGFTRKKIEQHLVDALGDIASAAGAVVLNHRGCGASSKADGSPVTIADQEAEALVLERLRTVLPGVPVVSEEAAAAGRIPTIDDDFILVDALDGTKEFIAGSDEFTVNIALIHAGVPVAAALFAPAMGRLWLAGAGADVCTLQAGAKLSAATERRKIAVREPKPNQWVAIASLRHGGSANDAFLGRFPVAEKRFAGSSLKFCLVAAGEADLYPRFSPTMEWDTAAGQAMLEAAGGAVIHPDGRPFRYGKAEAGFFNGAFVALGSPGLIELVRTREGH